LNDADWDWLKKHFPNEDGTKFSLSKIEVHLIQDCKISPSIFKDLSWVNLLTLLRNSEFSTKEDKNDSPGNVKLSPADQAIKKEIDKTPGQQAQSISNKTKYALGTVLRSCAKLIKSFGYIHIDNGEERGYYPPKKA
jgi:hypothetical protein